MQDRYTGDIGDFGKYGLLRALTSGSEDDLPLRLGVVWYLTNPESNNDGRHVSYLWSLVGRREYRERDPALFDLLQRLVRSGSRSVRMVREWGLLPPRTIFVENLVGSGRLRDDWCDTAVRSTADADLVFLDPDNGLEVRSVGRRRSKAPKYTYYLELLPYIERGQSLVVYHHLGQRHRTAAAEIEDRLRELEEFTGVKSFAVRFQGGTARAFFVIPGGGAEARLIAQTERFLKTGWAARRLFEDRIYA